MVQWEANEQNINADASPVVAFVTKASKFDLN